MQAGDGHQDVVVQRISARMNWKQCADRVNSMTWPGKDANLRLGYCLESNTQLALFKRTGWSGGIPDIVGPDGGYTWGWGGAIAIRDWTEMLYRITTFSYELFNGIRSEDCTPDLIFLPSSDTTPYMTAEDKYIYGRENLVSLADFRAGASRHSAPPPITGGDMPCEAAAANGERKDGRDGSVGQGDKEKKGMSTAEVPLAVEGKTKTPEAGTVTTKVEATPDKVKEEEKEGKKKKDEISPNPAPAPKLGTDVKSAAVNIDHRAAESAT